MKIFVTGANGLLGSNLVRELLDRQYQVKAFLLPNSDMRSLEGLDFEPVYGNILEPAGINEAVAGCDAIIHVAADTSVWPSRSERVRAINIDGTQNLIEAALKNDIKRFVHIGSGSSFGFGSKENPGNETTPFIGDKYGLDYIDSKYEGQLLVLKAVEEKDLPAIIVTPTFMFGAYDSKPGSGRMLLTVQEKKVPAFSGGGRNFVYAKDVAVAVANALTMGRIGESYIAGHQNFSYKEIFGIISEVLEVPPPKIQVNDFFLKVGGFLGTTVGVISGKAPKISYPMAKIACEQQYFSSVKAVEELQMPQTDIRVAIKDAMAWFKSAGYC